MKAYTKTNLLLFSLVFSIAFCSTATAQKFKYSIPGLDTLEESFIVQGGASTVLKNGEAEVILNNSLVSYWIAIHENGDNSPILDRFRRTQFNTDIFGFYGISQNGQWDIGLQMRYSRSRLDNIANNSMFKVFEADGGASQVESELDPSGIFDRSFGGVASIGLRFRWKPIALRPELVVNGGYALATVKDDVTQTQLGADRDIFDVGVTYYKSISRNVYYFFGAAGQVYLPSPIKDEFLFTASGNFFLIQRTNDNKITVYPGLAYGINFKPSKFDQSALIKTTDFLFAFVGVQYAFTPRINAFANFGLPLIIDVKHPQQEIVRNSYSIISLGARAGF